MEEIYEEYSEYVFNYLKSLTNNIDVAEELTQETFYSAIKNIHKYREESSLKTWLFKIAKNIWINYYKKSKKIKKVNIDEISEDLLLVNSSEKKN